MDIVCFKLTLTVTLLFDNFQPSLRDHHKVCPHRERYVTKLLSVVEKELCTAQQLFRHQTHSVETVTEYSDISLTFS